MKTPFPERQAAPFIAPLLLETTAEFSLPHANELRALNGAQMRDRCRSLARAGRSEHEIAVSLRWSLDLVRGALSQDQFR